MEEAEPAKLPEDSNEHKHRDVSSGGIRAAVFGLSDGLVTNVSLILGVAGAHPGGAFVRLAGVAGLVAGAFSMAAWSAWRSGARRWPNETSSSPSTRPVASITTSPSSLSPR